MKKINRNVLEADYRARAGWALPIRAAIARNPVLATRDKQWRNANISDLAFAIETRLSYLPRIVVFLDDNLDGLRRELSPALIRMHLSRKAQGANVRGRLAGA